MRIVICLTDATFRSAGIVLAQQLTIPWVDSAQALPGDCTHVLWLGAEGLALGKRGHNVPAATRVDFLDGTLQYRLRTSGKRQGLGKAVGLDKAAGISVLDATAGLGRDALVLAHLGCEVTLMERSAVMHSLLADGFARAMHDESMRATLARMTLVQGDAMQRFAAIARQQYPQPDVVYLDPMFPVRNKSASVKKDIALLQALLGVEENFPALLQGALQCARRRVVVKRPGNHRRAEADDVPVPDLVIPGKSAHFEVYVNSSFSSMR